MGNLSEFISYLGQQVENHSIYVWAAQGQKSPTITEAWIRDKETSTTNANRAIKFWKKQVSAGYGDVLRAFDCSGLGMYWLYNVKKLLKSDMSSNTMKGKCTILSKSELKKGDWVFRVYKTGSKKGRAYHIGYVVDEALNVIEAKGRDDGVVKRTLNASSTTYWNAFGRPIIFAKEINGDDTDEYVEVIGKAVNVRSQPSKDGAVLGIAKKGDKYPYISTAETGWYEIEYQNAFAYISNRNDLTRVVTGASWTLTRLLKKTAPLMKGEDVQNAQKALISRGFSCGPSGVDGQFGTDSKAATISFQQSAGLHADGIIGKDTCVALGGIWAG